MKNEKIQTLRLGELFCGPGGIGLGAKLADIKGYHIIHEWATDYDKDSCETYRYNLMQNEPQKVIEEDITKIQMNKLSDIDILAFGFPCNDFSLVGEKKGINGVFGGLYLYGIKALKHFTPNYFIAENVGGLRNANDGETLRRILDEMQGCGYNVTAHYYKFENYNVPQSRHRIIIVGIKDTLNMSFKVPAPLNQKTISCKYALENPPIKSDAFNHEIARQSIRVTNRLKLIKPGENAFNADLPDELKLNVNGAKISVIYKRLDPNKPSYTITGSGGGGTHVYHWQEPRALTNREKARLQTFPDNYKFIGSKESVRRQVGMAVPPHAVKIVFESLLKTIKGENYPFVEPNIYLEPILIAV